MTRTLQLAAGTAVLLLLGACGGGDDGICRSVSGAGVQTSSEGCFSCSVDDTQAVADGNFGSFATLRINGAASASLRASLPAGERYATGRRIGAYWSNASGSTYSLTLRTLLDGVVQESFNLCAVCGTNNPQPARYDGAGAATTQPFNAVEIELGGGQSNPGAAVFEVHELCSG